MRRTHKINIKTFAGIVPVVKFGFVVIPTLQQYLSNLFYNEKKEKDEDH